MKSRKSWIGILCTWILVFVLNVAARTSETFAEWYAAAIYPFFVNTVGRVSAIFPFSLIELLLYGFLFGVLFMVIRGLVQITGGRRSPKMVLQSAGKTTLAVTGSLLLTFTLWGGMNYQRDTFTEAAGFSIEESGTEELIALCEELVVSINEDAAIISLDTDGSCEVDQELCEKAVTAIKALGEEYSVLAGYYPKPKPIFFSDILSYQKLTGIYSPFTIEANYNQDIPAYDLPHTLCHELSHLKGFMREDEANFIAYLACSQSEFAEFRYSGNLVAYIYVGNALYQADPDAWIAIRDRLCDTAIRDLDYNSWFWKQFDGSLAEVANQVNDTYLKANNQTDGVASYGRMVDLLLAYRRATGQSLSTLY